MSASDALVSAERGQDPAGDAVHIMFETFRVLGLSDVVVSGQQMRGPLAAVAQSLSESRRPMICADGRNVIAFARGHALVNAAPVVAIIDSYAQLLQSFRDLRAAAQDGLNLMVVVLQQDPEDELAENRGVLNALLGNRVKWAGQLKIDSPIAETFCAARSLSHEGGDGPVVVSLELGTSGSGQVAQPNWRDLNRYLVREKTDVPYQSILEAGTILREADQPVVLLGRMPRDPVLWSKCICLIEALGAQVISDARRQPPFPIGHPMHKRVGADDPAEIVRIIRSSDVVLIVEWDELPELFAEAFRGKHPVNFVINVSAKGSAPRNFLERSGTPAPVDMLLTVSPGVLVETLHDKVIQPQDMARESKERDWDNYSRHPYAEPDALYPGLALPEGIKPAFLYGALPVLPGDGPFLHPLDYIGMGSVSDNHVACSIGMARALARFDRLPIARAGLDQVVAAICELHRAKQQKTGILYLVDDIAPSVDDQRLVEAILGQQNIFHLGTQPETGMKNATQSVRKGAIAVVYTATEKEAL